jgi:flagellar assembly factor FliW
VQIDTHAFGTIEIDESQVIRLTEAMAGFPDHTRFAVLDPDPEVPFKWFQSVDSADVCFLISDPAPFFPEYRVELSKGQLQDLQITEQTDTAVAVVLRVPEEMTGATANLLAPFVFNTQAKLARQIILEGSGHPVRAPLLAAQK